MNLLAGDVHGRQRGRTGRVHRHARTAQIEAIGNAVGRDAVRAAGRRMGADARAVGGAALDVLVVIVRDPDEDPDVGAALQIQDHARVLDRLPCRFQKQPLLRINVGRLPRRDAEKLRVKLVDPVEKSSALGDRLAGDPGFGVIKPLHIPPVGGHFGHDIATFGQQLPKRLRVVDSAGETAADADDCDTFLLHTSGAVQRGIDYAVNSLMASHCFRTSPLLAFSRAISWTMRRTCRTVRQANRTSEEAQSFFHK